MISTFLLVFGWTSIGFPQTPYYQGKTITIVTGSLAGELYDLYARMLAAHIARHIPGNPNVIVQNMPGAGHIVAANYVYAVAKPDGLTLLAAQPNLYIDQLIGRSEIKFDWAKFAWIGNASRTADLLYVRSDSPYKTIDDVQSAKEAPKCGATGTGTTGYMVPKLLEETIGAKFNVITGYKGGSETDLAVERGEVQCRAFSLAAFFGREPYHTWRKTGFVRVLVQLGRNRDGRLAEVPTLNELMDKYKTPDPGRRVATIVTASEIFQRPYMGSPGMRPEHLKIIREAFQKTMNDSKFLEEVKSKKLDIEATPGDEMETLAKEVMSQRPEIVERLKKVLGH
ncbi:MAG TPA: tripartite tricarboxylate transporter substrate-binding protein [Pyrinomonadaceae bacterium]|jgi:tripartite-type tricarboxylate transporter receptor subunit TctC